MLINSTAGLFNPELFQAIALDTIPDIQARRCPRQCADALAGRRHRDAERILAEGFSQKLFQKAAKLASLGVARPEDLAAIAVFLAGPGGAKITGQAISVNGGISAA